MRSVHKTILTVAFTCLLLALGSPAVIAQQPIIKADGSVSMTGKNCTITIVPYAKNVVKLN